MLTPTERRQRAFLLAEAADASTQAARFAGRMVAMMEREADGMLGMFGNHSCSSLGRNLINPLIKPVGDACNLRCRYCFNFPGQRLQVMKPETLELIVSQSLQLSPTDITFILHGGEPLLAGIGFFEKFVELQKRYARPGQVIHNGVTTNGTLLNEKWCRFFKENDIGVAISIDGPAPIHDSNRIFPDGRGSYEYAIEGVRVAQAMGLQVNILAVAGNGHGLTAREQYNFMRSQGARSWRANFCREKGGAAAYPAYVEELFDAWCEDETECTIGIIKEVLRGLFGYPAQDCWMAGGCSKNIGFEPDGTVSPCCEISIGEEFRFGNVHEEPLDAILSSPSADKFWMERRKGDSKCSGCEWIDLCSGGCTFHRIESSGTPEGTDYMCATYKEIFARLAARVDSLLGELSKVAA